MGLEFLPLTDELFNQAENIRRKYYRAIQDPPERRFVVNELASLLNRYWKDLIKPRMPLGVWRTSMNLLQDIIGDEFKGKPGVRQGLKWLEGSKSTKEFVEYIARRVQQILSK
ncbi:hypothetical protein J7L27_06080 [Candidatus Bathyarchaeota archaeon]|nr:hypothetical protein [Candidatus Bathyarchaeota archaeon]